MPTNSDSHNYYVVKNHEGQLSIWPEYRIGTLPAGWHRIGVPGSKQACLDSIILSESKVPVHDPQHTRAHKRPANKTTSLPFPCATAETRLFVFPHAGSGASFYHFLARACKNDPIEIYIIQYPGREMRMQESPITTMDAMVTSLLAELHPLLSEKPFAFFGHSMGALTAFELTHALMAHEPAVVPRHLFLSGRQAPHLPATNLNVAQLDDAAFLDAVGRRYRALPPELLANPEIVALILPSLRADFTLMERYSHKQRPPLDIPFTLINGENDMWFDPKTIAEWHRHTTRPLNEHILPGDHFYMSSAVAQIRTLLLKNLVAGNS